MEFSTMKAGGDVTIPKSIRDLLDLEEGAKLAFIEEDGKVILAKGDQGLLGFQQFSKEFSKFCEERGISEKELLNDAERIREDMYREWSKQ